MRYRCMRTTASGFGFMDKLKRLCVLCNAILVCFSLSATIAFAASTQVGPLSPAQQKALKPRDTFRECQNCPEMTVVPAGSFTMGSPPSEPARSADEGPQHKVTIARQFAVGRFEVTFAEWDA